MRRIAIGRSVGLLIALVGVSLSVWLACDALRMNAEFHQWLSARPLETAIDLSEPGETTVPFHQTCSSSHGEALFFECDSLAVAKQTPEELFKGLAASVVIKDVNGDEVETVAINIKTIHHWDGQLQLAGFAPFRIGEYVATIRVDSGIRLSPTLGKQSMPSTNSVVLKRCPP